jgi:hypothetical protein
VLPHSSSLCGLLRRCGEPGRVQGDGVPLRRAPGAFFVLVLALNGLAVSVEQLVGLIQDLFLLPQVIGNAVWRVNCKPLAEGYYLSVTAVRLLPHAYAYVRPPLQVAYSHDESMNGSRSMVFPSAGDLVVPAVAVLLGLVVYLQQRWNYAIVGRMGVAEKRKWRHTMSRMDTTSYVPCLGHAIRLT